MFVAKLIAPDGFTDRKQFEARKDAFAWLNGEGKRNFEGEIEKAELWADNELIWSKQNWKTDDKYYTDSWWYSHVRVPREHGTPPVRKARKWSR